MKTEYEYFDVVSGNVYDDIAVKHGSKTLFLRPIFIENDVGECEVLCYIPQDLQANQNELFAKMVCELLQAGMQEAFQEEALPESFQETNDEFPFSLMKCIKAEFEKVAVGDAVGGS